MGTAQAMRQGPLVQPAPDRDTRSLTETASLFPTSRPPPSGASSGCGARGATKPTSPTSPASTARPCCRSCGTGPTSARSATSMQWLPGIHEPLVTVEQFEAVTREPGHRSSTRQETSCRGESSVGSAIVVCPSRDNGRGQIQYRCAHRGKGCDTLARSNRGLLEAAKLGLRLIGHDDDLREAISQELEAARRAPQGALAGRLLPATALDRADRGRRRKLLRAPLREPHLEGSVRRRIGPAHAPDRGAARQLTASRRTGQAGLRPGRPLPSRRRPAP